MDTPTPDTVKSVGGGVVGRQWAWLLDVERACGLVVGRCLEGMLLGPPLTPAEERTKDWLTLRLLSCGLASNDLCAGQFDYGVICWLRLDEVHTIHSYGRLGKLEKDG